MPFGCLSNKSRGAFISEIGPLMQTLAPTPLPDVSVKRLCSLPRSPKAACGLRGYALWLPYTTKAEVHSVLKLVPICKRSQVPLRSVLRFAG
jgi:hypothetical protein